MPAWWPGGEKSPLRQSAGDGRGRKKEDWASVAGMKTAACLGDWPIGGAFYGLVDHLNLSCNKYKAQLDTDR